MLDGEAEALTRKAVEMALAGDTTALRLCLDRILPPRRERPVNFKLPNLQKPTDAAGAMAAITGAVAAAEITPSEAGKARRGVRSGVGGKRVRSAAAEHRGLEGSRRRRP